MVRYVVALFALRILGLGILGLGILGLGILGSGIVGSGILGLAFVPYARAQSGWNNPGLNMQQQTAMVWREMSDCARQAAKQYADHTPEGNAKREASRLDCLRRNHLPVTTEPRRYY